MVGSFPKEKKIDLKTLTLKVRKVVECESICVGIFITIYFSLFQGFTFVENTVFIESLRVFALID